MKRLSFLAVGSSILLAAVSCSHKSEQYTINGQFEDDNDVVAMLISSTTGDTIAIDTIREGRFQFVGEAPVATLAQLRVGGRGLCDIVLEPGVINISREALSGTPLNEKMNDYYQKQDEVYKLLESASNDSIKREEAMAQYELLQVYADSIMNANLDNPVGASFFISNAYELNVDELENILNEHPNLKAYSKINKILDQKKLAAETGVGKKYKDFEVSYDGKTTKLSDYMKPDHYTLVDFWASWCGPCRREIPVIKEIQEQWGPKGLDVVGVAVWDEPAATERAIEDLGIDWPVIINAQTIPTDIYGILGIPCIILISPDGTILARDLQDEELKAAVAEAMENK